MSADQTIDYESLAQDAMRGVVRAVLRRVLKHGLPGDHHFYIAFDTQAPGVSISSRLEQKYPTEMTVVLQHRFWDLHVNDERFEIKLTFDNIPERLVVPFNAIKVFFDPSVPYGLQFEEPDVGADQGSELGGPNGRAPAPNGIHPGGANLTQLQPPKRKAPPRKRKPKPKSLVAETQESQEGRPATDVAPAGDGVERAGSTVREDLERIVNSDGQDRHERAGNDAGQRPTDNPPAPFPFPGAVGDRNERRAGDGSSADMESASDAGIREVSASDLDDALHFVTGNGVAENDDVRELLKAQAQDGEAEEEKENDAEDNGGAANVVSLDAFRKK